MLLKTNWVWRSYKTLPSLQSHEQNL